MNTTYTFTMVAKLGEQEATAEPITVTTPGMPMGKQWCGRHFLKLPDGYGDFGRDFFYICNAPGTYEDENKYVLNFPLSVGYRRRDDMRTSMGHSGQFKQYPASG